jgi:hypothetical protein
MTAIQAGAVSEMAGFGNERLLLRGPSGVADQSSSGNDGVFQGGMGTVADTESGGAVAFLHDGIDDRITVADSDSLSFLGQPFSVGGWVRKTANVTSGLLAKASAAASGEWYILFGSANSIVFRLVDNTNAAAIGIETQLNVITNNDWQLIVATSSGSESVSGLKIYRNTSLISTFTSNFGSGFSQVRNTSQDITIGSRGSATFLPGRTDDIRVIPAELTLSQVQAWHAAGRGYNVAPTIFPRRRRSRSGGGVL